MQTFLPYPDFLESANVLDKKRCWKQVVEAHQIIDILTASQSYMGGIVEPRSWRNHPAVKMWEGHIPELKIYFNCFLKTCVEVYGINTAYVPYNSFTDFCNVYHQRDFIHDSVILKMPWWHGNINFHRAMRARLIEKDEAFYLPKFPNDKGFNNGKYFWPVMDGSETFKII